MGRLFRPIRILSRNEGLKVSIKALFVSIPAILRLMMIVILFFTIFAVMGITLFKGYFEYCMLSPNDSGKLEQLILNDIIDNKYKCINYGGEWRTYYKNFDDLGTALI